MGPKPIWTLWSRENLVSSVNQIRAVQPVAHPYTDWAIPALCSYGEEDLIKVKRRTILFVDFSLIPYSVENK
jgi:hypothetical protein